MRILALRGEPSRQHDLLLIAARQPRHRRRRCSACARAAIESTHCTSVALLAPIESTSTARAGRAVAATCCAARSPTARVPAACDPPARGRCPSANRVARDRRCAPRVRARRSVPTSPAATPNSARRDVGAARRRPGRRVRRPRRRAARTRHPRTCPASDSPSTRSSSSLDAASRVPRQILGERTPDHHLHELAPPTSSAAGRVATCRPSRSTLTVSHSRKISGMRCET